MADRPLLPWEKSDQKFDRPSSLDLGTVAPLIIRPKPKKSVQQQNDEIRRAAQKKRSDDAKRAKIAKAVKPKPGPSTPLGRQTTAPKPGGLNQPTAVVGGIVTLPKKVPPLARDIFQATNRRLGQFAISATPQGQGDRTLTPSTTIQRAIFGKEPIKPFRAQIEGATKTAEELRKQRAPYLPGIASPIVGGLATAGGVLADLYPGRPGGNIVAKTILKEIEESVGKKVGTELAAKITREAEVILKLPKGEARASAIALLRKKYAPESLAANGFLTPRPKVPTQAVDSPLLTEARKPSDINFEWQDRRAMGGGEPLSYVTVKGKDVGGIFDASEVGDSTGVFFKRTDGTYLYNPQTKTAIWPNEEALEAAVRKELLPKTSTTVNPLLAEARKYKSAEEFVRAQQPTTVELRSSKLNKDYMGGHEAPMAEDINAPIWDLTGKYTGKQLYPKDVYGADASRMYSSGSEFDGEAMSILHSTEGRPNASITVYRAVPKDVKGEINPGDWVTITLGYAKEHGESNLGNNFKIISKQVRARDIFTDANSIQEFGYDPQAKLPPSKTPYDFIERARSSGKPTIYDSHVSQLTSIWEEANRGRIKTPPAQAAGAAAGFQVETDENGNKRLKYNPLGGVLGVAGVSAANSKKVRGFIQSVKSSPIVSKITKAGFAKGGATYNVITDEAALEAAGKRIAASVSDSIAYVMGAKNPTKEHTTTAIKLIDTLEQNGNHSAASEVIEKYAADLTKQGQSVQAASLFGRLSPEGVLIYAQRQLNKFNQNRLFPTWTKSVILNEKDATVLRDLASEVKRSDSLLSKNEAIQELQFALNAMIPSTIGRKISTAQTIAQLLNPKTFVRNILGNELFYRLERLNKIFVATPIDVLNSKITGADRTITFRGVKGQESYWSAWMRGTKLGWKGITPEGLGTQFDLGRTATFTGKWNPFTYLEKTMGAALRGSDYAAFVRARNGVIGELAQLHVINSGLKGEARQKALQGFIRDVDENVLNIANEYGKYVTYQDDNFISTGFSKIKKGLNVGQDFGLGDLILKYPKTPGAILARALEYSPVGFLKSAYQVAYPFMHGAKPQTRDVIMSLSRAITGSIGATGLAYYLASKGILTGKQETDPDIAALNRTVGGGGYKVNISALSRWVRSGFKDSEANTKEGDTMYSYDWAQPIAIAWSLGANAQKNVEEQKNPLDPRGIPETIMSSVEGAMQTILEQPLLRGLKNLSFRDMASFNNTFASIGEGIPASFVPTLFRQVQTFHNNIASETYDPRFFQKMMNEAKAKIPGLADRLNQRITTLGEPQEVYQGGSNNAFNVFFNPGFISKYTPVEVAQEVVALFERTGEKKQAPILVKRKQSVNGQDIVLSDDQYYEMQKFVGQETVKRYTKIIQSPKYQNMSDEERVNALYGELNDIRLEARIKILGHNPDKKKSTQPTQPTNTPTGRAKLPWE